MAALMASRASCSRPTMAVRPRQASSRVAFSQVQRFNRVVVRAENAPASTSAAPSAAVAEVTDETFEAEVLNHTDTPVLVDFWAPWCGPCRFIAPLIDELAVEYSGKLKVVKLDTDKSGLTATQLGIRSIPTVIIFKNGEKKDSVIGAVPKETLVQTIEKFL